MFLKRNRRRKDGKDHYYWNIVENKRVSGGRVVQRQVLYLGEINDSQQAAWRKTLEIFEEGKPRPDQIALFPDERAPEIDDESIVRIRLKDLTIENPRQWGACWLACLLYEQLSLGEFWRERLPPSREGTDWADILQTLVSYRLISPRSEWRLHREWFQNSAMADLLGSDFSLAEKNALYRCHDRLAEHKKALFAHLTEKWSDLFNARYDVLLYDLTGTYFECDPNEEPAASSRLRKRGYSRDKRPDCLQVVIALIVTPEGFPIAYEILPGNTQDKTTLADFLSRIEKNYGKADRIWSWTAAFQPKKSFAHHPQFGRPRANLALLPAIDRDRASLQRDEKRLGDPAHLSPERRANRSAHLHQFSFLLPVGDPEAPPARSGTRPDPGRSALKTLRLPDARRKTPDHRRPHGGADPPHRAQRRSKAGIGTDETGTPIALRPPPKIESKTTEM